MHEHEQPEHHSVALPIGQVRQHLLESLARNRAAADFPSASTRQRRSFTAAISMPSKVSEVRFSVIPRWGGDALAGYWFISCGDVYICGRGKRDHATDSPETNDGDSSSPPQEG